MFFLLKFGVRQLLPPIANVAVLQLDERGGEEEERSCQVVGNRHQEKAKRRLFSFRARASQHIPSVSSIPWPEMVNRLAGQFANGFSLG